MLLEKAWAKCCGSYARTFYGNEQEGLRFFTGAPCEVLNREDYGMNELWDQLEQAQIMGYAVCGGVGEETRKKKIEKTGLSTLHAYTVLGVYDIEDARLVKI